MRKNRCCSKHLIIVLWVCISLDCEFNSSVKLCVVYLFEEFYCLSQRIGFCFFNEFFHFVVLFSVFHQNKENKNKIGPSDTEVSPGYGVAFALTVVFQDPRSFRDSLSSFILWLFCSRKASCLDCLSCRFIIPTAKSNRTQIRYGR